MADSLAAEVKQWTLDDIVRLNNEVRDATSLLCYTWGDFKYGSGQPDAVPGRDSGGMERLEYVATGLMETIQRLSGLTDDIRRRV